MTNPDFLSALLSLKALLEENEAEKALELVNKLAEEAKKSTPKKTVYTIDEIKEKVAPIAKKYNIDRVYLFGSYARGEADENSDVDLLLDYEHLGGGMFAIGGVYCDFEECFENGVDIVSQKAMEENRSRCEADMFFYNSVMKDRVLIYG